MASFSDDFGDFDFGSKAWNKKVEDMLKDYASAKYKWEEPKYDWSETKTESKKSYTFKNGDPFEELRKYSKTVSHAQVSVEKLTIAQIDAELDICRGIKPTPKGYIVDSARMKDLMRQRKDLAS